MKRMMAILGVTMAMAGGAMAAPFNAAQVGANAKWVLHLDVDGLKNTQVGRLLLQRMTTGADNNKMNALAAILGSDLRKDLAGLTLYGPSDAENDGVVILNGRFNQQQLETFVKADEAYRSETYKNATIHSWVDKKKKTRMYGSILNGGAMIVLSGSNTALKSELDVIGGLGSSLAMQGGGLDLSSANSAVLVGAADFSRMKNNKASAQTLKQAKSATASISEQGAEMVGNIALVADSAENAQHLNDAARGILALMQLDDKTDQKTKDAFRATTIDLQGSTLKVGLHMPAQVMVDALQKKMMEDDAKKAAAATPDTQQK